MLMLDTYPCKVCSGSTVFLKVLTTGIHMQASADDARDELRGDSGKRNSSDGDSACSREHAADGRAPVQGAAAVAPLAAMNATTAAAVANGLAATDPFAAWRIAQGLAAANNATARARWATAGGGLPIAALLTAGSGAAASGDNGGAAMPGSFPLPLANGGVHPAAAWNGYGASLLNGGLNGETCCSPCWASPTHMACCTRSSGFSDSRSHAVTHDHVVYAEPGVYQCNLCIRCLVSFRSRDTCYPACKVWHTDPCLDVPCLFQQERRRRNPNPSAARAARVRRSRTRGRRQGAVLPKTEAGPEARWAAARTGLPCRRSPWSPAAPTTACATRSRHATTPRRRTRCETALKQQSVNWQQAAA